MLLGFKKRFANPILTGSKIFTLRNERKVQPKLGETLYMYTGLRTNQCELITNKEKLKGMQKAIVSIDNTKGLVITITVDGKQLTKSQIATFVKYDGFIDRYDFADYWLNQEGKRTQKVYAELTMYHWTDFKY